MSAPTQNPFRPPGSQLESEGVDRNGEMAIAYRLTALDHLWFSICAVHTRLIPQMVLLLASAYTAKVIATDRFLLMFVAAYLAMSVFQVGLTGLMVLLARNGRLLTEHHTALTAAGMVISTRYVKALYYWNGIDRVRTFPWIIAVFVNANSAQIIPKRAFTGDAQLARFLAIIAERQSDA